MKRAVTLVLLAATTALTVPAAVAQDSDANEVRAQRQEARQANRAQRQEARQQRRIDSPRVQAPAPTQVAPAQAAPAPVAIVAQRRNRDGEGRRGDRGNRPNTPQSQTVRDAWQGNPNDAARDRYERQAAENAMRYGTREQRREVRQDIRQDRREDRRDWREDRRGDRGDWRQDRRGDRREWRRDWRNDRRYDWNHYRNQNRFIFRLNPYYSPYGYGYGYRRFGIGSILDSLLFGRNYWVSDPWQYRLPPAPPGYQWVRYYNDVILVDTWNGQVVDVIYDFFW